MAYRDQTQGFEFVKSHPEELRELGLVRVNEEKLTEDLKDQLDNLLKLRDRLQGEAKEA